MAKLSQHYPEDYARIGPATVELGRLEVSLETTAQANSMKTGWNNYVAALLREQQMELWASAIRVIATVKGNKVIFSDRNKSVQALALKEALPAPVVDDIDISFMEMMAEKARREREGK
jgi:hypothetical protein